METALNRVVRHLVFGTRIDALRGKRRIGAVKRGEDRWHVWEDDVGAYDVLDSEELLRAIDGMEAWVNDEPLGGRR